MNFVSFNRQVDDTAEYGEPLESGLSPTEEEFEEALRSGRPLPSLATPSSTCQLSAL